MTEYALLKYGHIVNVVTTARSLPEVQDMFPEHEVKALASCSAEQKRAYRYWSERP